LNISSSEAPEIVIETRDRLFDKGFLTTLSEALPAFLRSRRWYQDKTRNIAEAAIQDVIVFDRARSYVLPVKLVYEEGGTQLYVLAFSVVWDGTEPLGREAADNVAARLRTADGEQGFLYDAFWNPQFRSELFKLIAGGKSISGRHSELVAAQTAAFSKLAGADLRDIDSVVSRAEQSNTSLIFGDKFILKVFRKLEQGINPDVEVGMFLTEREFKHTPAVAGRIEYAPVHGSPAYFAILQQFVKNQGDAWKYTLDSLGGFFGTALARGTPPTLPTYHPLQLMAEEATAQARDLIGSYLDSARLLGKRTAELHAALADENAEPDFAPERFTYEDRQNLYLEMKDQADTAFQLLREQQEKLTGAERDEADEVLSAEKPIRDRFQPLLNQNVTAMRIRHHGDYHLGQVLYTGTDFMIIDFEGEPARPLAERRLKRLALRDVAGMIRSFQYASYAALFGQVPGTAIDSERADDVEGWAAYWTAYVGAEYLKGYFETAGHLAFVPASEGERRLLLDVFILQKALYEVAYELNNRPAWVRIPLRGILTLLA
jgi:maltose alpha-D-glucosyltransferase/alpha-amylase